LDEPWGLASLYSYQTPRWGKWFAGRSRWLV